MNSLKSNNILPLYPLPSKGNVLKCVHIWSLPWLQEVFSLFEDDRCSHISGLCVEGVLPGLDEVPRTSS